MTPPPPPAPYTIPWKGTVCIGVEGGRTRADTPTEVHPEGHTAHTQTVRFGEGTHTRVSATACAGLSPPPSLTPFAGPCVLQSYGMGPSFVGRTGTTLEGDPGAIRDRFGREGCGTGQSGITEGRPIPLLLGAGLKRAGGGGATTNRGPDLRAPFRDPAPLP